MEKQEMKIAGIYSFIIFFTAEETNLWFEKFDFWVHSISIMSIVGLQDYWIHMNSWMVKFYILLTKLILSPSLFHHQRKNEGKPDVGSLRFIIIYNKVFS